MSCFLSAAGSGVLMRVELSLVDRDVLDFFNLSIVDVLYVLPLIRSTIAWMSEVGSLQAKPLHT